MKSPSMATPVQRAAAREARAGSRRTRNSALDRGELRPSRPTSVHFFAHTCETIAKNWLRRRPPEF